MQTKDKTIFTIKNQSEIVDYLESKSQDLKEIASYEYDEILLIHKVISHADIPFMKRTKPTDDYSKNLLYYLTAKETEELNLNETAHQTSLNPGTAFFVFLNIHKPVQTRNNSNIQRVNINQYAKIYLVNDDNLHYFSYDYTKKVITNLNKTIKNSNFICNNELVFEDKKLIEIPSITCSAHGLGTKNDNFFHKLRGSIFKGDIINILLTKKNNENTIYFLLEKNPRFYTIINDTNKVWEKYLLSQLKINQLQINNTFTPSQLDVEEKTRKFQSKWKNNLADEAMIYTKSDKIICPISGIEATRDNFLTLFRASHIKNFSSCDDNSEAYDINNGLLLSANIDALFDKFLISIDNSRKLNLSFLFSTESDKLLDDLRIYKNKEIPAYFLNDERMKFMSWHYEQFKKKEKERKIA